MLQQQQEGTEIPFDKIMSKNQSKRIRRRRTMKRMKKIRMLRTLLEQYGILIANTEFSKNQNVSKTRFYVFKIKRERERKKRKNEFLSEYICSRRNIKKNKKENMNKIIM